MNVLECRLPFLTGMRAAVAIVLAAVSLFVTSQTAIFDNRFVLEIRHAGRIVADPRMRRPGICVRVFLVAVAAHRAGDEVLYRADTCSTGRSYRACAAG